MLACDLIERLIDFAGADFGGDTALRNARRALQDALREFPGLHRWQYHYGHGRIQLSALYNTGTIAYNSSTRALTLTGGTWPTWAANGKVRINDLVSYVSSRDSGTVLTLDTIVHPHEDIDAGTSYTLSRDTYDLPADFVASDFLMSQQWLAGLQYLHPNSVEWMERTAEQVGTPEFYTFWPSRTALGRMAVRVSPVPDASETIDFLYQRRMRRVAYDLTTAGTVSVASAGTALTGSGTAFTSNMVGATIRLSTGSTPPTGSDGANPNAFETVVAGYSSASAITLTDAAPSDFVNVAYVLSDPLDMNEGVMATAFCWRAISHMAAALRMKDRATIETQAMQFLTLAKEQDSLSFAQKVAGSTRMRRSSWYGPTGDDEV